MQVNQSTDKLYFVSEKFDTVDVKITNQYTKKVTFEKTLSVTEEGYYNVITDNDFNFEKNQTYILDIYADILIDKFIDRVEADNGIFENKNCILLYLNYKSDLIYRSTIYSDVDDVYLNANKINTQDEYITV